MKVAIVSDVHGSMAGFEAVLADVERAAPDLVIHGGDLVLNGPRPAEVVDRIRELGWPGILGNTDEALWQLPPALPEPVKAAFGRRTAATRELIGEERLAWLRGLAAEWRGDGIALVHAVPGDSWALVPADAPDERLRQVYGPLDAPLAVYCHIHAPFVRELSDVTVANSGSAGAPYDGDPRPSWLLIDNGRAEVRRVEYDLELAVAQLRGSGYPDAEALADMLRTATFRMPGR